MFFYSNRKNNRRTINVYNKHPQEYIQRTPLEYTSSHERIKSWIDTSLAFIDPKGKVLEIGSATPRDAHYMQSKGFAVLCSDAAPTFVDYLRVSGVEAIRLDVLRDTIPRSYDMIFANAVIPHFTARNLKTVLGKVHAALPARGIFAFSAKQGKGEDWISEKLSEKRYTHYWDADTLCKIVSNAGFTVVFREADIAGDLPSHTLIHITAQKNS